MIKESQRRYLARIADLEQVVEVARRFAALSKALRVLLRKDAGSGRSFKALPRVARMISSLDLFLGTADLPKYDFAREKSAVNAIAISGIGDRLQSKYDGQCASYGEAILNGYLDVFIGLTAYGAAKEIAAKPAFLIYPLTGSGLELDVIIEDFKLAFEFQGEHHYSDAGVRAKDQFKLARCGNTGRILIPVNISQLNGGVLRELILNSIKDQRGLHEVVLHRDAWRYVPGASTNTQILQFCKAIDRFRLATNIYGETLDWLDGESKAYIANSLRRSPVSGTSPAPRSSPALGDLAASGITSAVKYISRARRVAKSSSNKSGA